MRFTAPASLLVALAACSGASHPVPLAAPCTVPDVDSTGGPWRAVQAKGFKFCVPADWTPHGPARGGADAFQWSGRGASLTWGTDQAMQEGDIIGTVTYLTDQPAATFPQQGVPAPPPAFRGSSPTCVPDRHSGYLIGSTVVMVIQRRCGGTYTTIAWSTDPEIHLRIDARSAAAAARLLAIVRTIRVTAAQH